MLRWHAAFSEEPSALFFEHGERSSLRWLGGCRHCTHGLSIFLGHNLQFMASKADKKKLSDQVNKVCDKQFTYSPLPDAMFVLWTLTCLVSYLDG